MSLENDEDEMAGEYESQQWLETAFDSMSRELNSMWSRKQLEGVDDPNDPTAIALHSRKHTSLFGQH